MDSTVLEFWRTEIDVGEILFIFVVEINFGITVNAH